MTRWPQESHVPDPQGTTWFSPPVPDVHRRPAPNAPTASSTPRPTPHGRAGPGKITIGTSHAGRDRQRNGLPALPHQGSAVPGGARVPSPKSRRGSWSAWGRPRRDPAEQGGSHRTRGLSNSLLREVFMKQHRDSPARSPRPRSPGRRTDRPAPASQGLLPPAARARTGARRPAPDELFHIFGTTLTGSLVYPPCKEPGAPMRPTGSAAHSWPPRPCTAPGREQRPPLRPAWPQIVALFDHTVSGSGRDQRYRTVRRE